MQFENPAEPNETHICGDMNIDVYQGKWLQSNYPLVSLSRLIKNMCHLNNFHQLVKDITRVQFNSVANTTDTSCIDHVYTNTKFRCSEPKVIAFGDSDHDLVKYTRYSKIPSTPARIICKRNYRNFEVSAFLQHVSQEDWSNVYCCNDVDTAVEIFTQKFKFILNCHAPWTRIQQRKKFVPWLTIETKKLMVERDNWKKAAADLALSSSGVCEAQLYAWEQYKKCRNKVNYRKKREEHLFKAEKLSEASNCPNLLWKSAKNCCTSCIFTQ